MQRVHQFLVGGFDQNCTYICIDPNTTSAVIVDPTGDLQPLHQHLNESDLTLQAIWLTHTHPDHVDGITEIRRTYGDLPIYVHTEGIPHIADHQNIHPLADQDLITVGDETWTVWHTPGHSVDSVCFWYQSTDPTPSAGLLSGDTLFVNGCGRTTPDEAPTLYASLQRLTELPDHTAVYPGHDYGPSPTSTILQEKQNNPYLQAPDLATFTKLRFPTG